MADEATRDLGAELATELKAAQARAQDAAERIGKLAESGIPSKDPGDLHDAILIVGQMERSLATVANHIQRLEPTA